MGTSRRRFLKLIGGAASAGVVLGNRGVSAALAQSKPDTNWDSTKPDLNWVPAASSNYSEANRETELDIRWYIVHTSQATYETTIDIFQDPNSNVSAHYVLDNNTGNGTQMVNEEDIAWHAGNWPYNQHSLGVEHEGFYGETNFTDALYKTSASIVQ